MVGSARFRHDGAAAPPADEAAAAAVIHVFVTLGVNDGLVGYDAIGPPYNTALYNPHWFQPEFLGRAIGLGEGVSDSDILISSVLSLGFLEHLDGGTVCGPPHDSALHNTHCFQSEFLSHTANMAASGATPFISSSTFEDLVDEDGLVGTHVGNGVRIGDSDVLAPSACSAPYFYGPGGVSSDAESRGALPEVLEPSLPSPATVPPAAVVTSNASARPMCDPHGNGARIGESDVSAPSDGTGPRAPATGGREDDPAAHAEVIPARHADETALGTM